jgi:glucosylceramidase
MKKYLSLLVCSLLSAASMAQDVKVWETTRDGQSRVALSSQVYSFSDKPTDRCVPITVDDRQHFQKMRGFGYALTGGSAELMMAMSSDARHDLILSLFGHGEGQAGISYIRLTVGASDMNSFVFSYDDMPRDMSDWDLKNFSLAQDMNDVVPVMREILAVNPDIEILASPWSAPTWMKTNNDVQGGKLRKECYDVYARYFVRYIQEMAKQGITISALTIQNEPLNSRNTPSMAWTPQEQAEFIADYLGPQFRKNGISTEIVLFDHNCDRPDYPLTILSNPKVSQYASGVAFHQYMGDHSGMTTVHKMRPDKDIFFTEQMIIDRSGSATATIAPVVERVVVNVVRNWSCNVILWNLAADADAGPHTDNGGCPFCHGAVTIIGNRWHRNIAFYGLSHASEFVPAGSYRISSTSPTDSGTILFEDEQSVGTMRAVEYEHSGVLPNVAFETPDGRIVLVVSNTHSSSESVWVRYHGKYCEIPLASGSVITLEWNK